MLPDSTTTGRVVGASFILQWFEAFFAEDEYAREATRRVLFELLVFYVFIAVGFLALYCTWRSNANLKMWKRDVARTLAEQRGRGFEPSDAAKLYFG